MIWRCWWPRGHAWGPWAFFARLDGTWERQQRVCERCGRIARRWA